MTPTTTRTCSSPPPSCTILDSVSTRQARLVSRSRAPIWLLPSSGAHGVAERDIDRVWEAIALHASLGIAHRRGLLTSLTHKGVFIDAGRITDGVADRLRQEVLNAYPRPRRRPLHRGRHRGPCDPFRCGRASRFARVRTPSPTPRSRARPSGAPAIDLKGGNRPGRRNFAFAGSRSAESQPTDTAAQVPTGGSGARSPAEWRPAWSGTIDPAH